MSGATSVSNDSEQAQKRQDKSLAVRTVQVMLPWFWVTQE